MSPYSRNIFPLLAAASVLAAQTPGPAPLTANFQDSASCRWLNKKVLNSRLLDDMSTLDHWSTFTNNPPPVVDSRVTAQVTQSQAVAAEMSLTKERSRDGRNSLRMRTPTKLNVPGPVNGRGWGETGPTEEMDGIVNMRVRLKKLGGRFAVASKTGEGTTVRFDMPLR